MKHTKNVKKMIFMVKYFKLESSPRLVLQPVQFVSTCAFHWLLCAAASINHQHGSSAALMDSFYCRSIIAAVTFGCNLSS